ncbi:hypothetical protein AAY473_008306 [Plecturocebus cupreus]
MATVFNLENLQKRSRRVISVAGGLGTVPCLALLPAPAHRDLSQYRPVGPGLQSSGGGGIRGRGGG